jgi:glutamate dehydrogenase
LENQITTENAKKVKARVIAEAANGPVTSEAADILNKKGVSHPSGYVSQCRRCDVSYFEWLKQFIAHAFWPYGKNVSRKFI